MRADQAVRASKNGQSEAHRRQVAEQRADAREKAKQERWELRTRLPAFMKEIYASIRRDAARGLFSTNWTVNYHLRAPTEAAIQKRLEKKGYSVAIRHREGTSNMGDFNAPCMTSWSATDVEIHWEKVR